MKPSRAQIFSAVCCLFLCLANPSWAAPRSAIAINSSWQRGLYVAYDRDSGYDQIFYASALGVGSRIRLTDSAFDKAAPQWGPRGVTYYFYDRVANEILTCDGGDLFYYLGENPDWELNLGCFNSSDGGATPAIADYPLTGFATAPDLDVASYAVASAEALTYFDSFEHGAYPVIVTDADGGFTLLLHDDEAHLGSTDYDDGFVIYDDVIVDTQESGVVISTGSGETEWDGTITCPDCVVVVDDEPVASEEETGNLEESSDTSATDNDLSEENSSDAFGGDTTDDEDLSDSGAASGSENVASTATDSCSCQQSSRGCDGVTSSVNVSVTVSVDASVTGASGDVTATASSQADDADVVSMPDDESAAISPDASVAAEPGVSGGFELSGTSIGGCSLDANVGAPVSSFWFAGLFVLSLLFVRRLRLLSRHFSLMSLMARCLAGIIFLQATLPAAALGADVSAVKIAIMPLFLDGDLMDQKSKSVANHLRNKLRTKFNVLSVTDVLQTVATGGGGDSAAIIRRADEVFDDYASFRRSAPRTLEALVGISRSIIATDNPSREMSRLLLTSKLSAAWLHYRQNEKRLAKDVLESLPEISLVDPLLGDYAPAFQRFVRDAFTARENFVAASLAVSSNPLAAEVYVDGVFFGVTPTTLNLSPGPHHVVWTSSGRLSAVRQIDAVSGKSRRIVARLPWNNKDDAHPMSRRKWRALPAVKRAALAASWASRSGSDLVIVLGADGDEMREATVYDARFGQFLTPWKSSLASEVAVLSSWQEKLERYLDGGGALASRRFVDSRVVVDPRIASRLHKSLVARPVFWVAVGAVVVGGVMAGLLVTQNQSSRPANGGLVVGF